MSLTNLIITYTENRAAIKHIYTLNKFKYTYKALESNSTIKRQTET